MKKKYGESKIFKDKFDIVSILLELKNKYDYEYINSNLYHRQIALGLDTSFSVNFKHPLGLYKLVKENDKYSFYAHPIFMLHLGNCTFFDYRDIDNIEINIEYNSLIKTYQFYKYSIFNNSGFYDNLCMFYYIRHSMPSPYKNYINVKNRPSLKMLCQSHHKGNISIGV